MDHHLAPVFFALTTAAGCAATSGPPAFELVNRPSAGEEGQSGARAPLHLSPLAHERERRFEPSSGVQYAPQPTVNRAARSDAALEARVASAKIAGLSFDSEPSLRAVMRYISSASDVPIHVWSEAEEAVIDDGATFSIDLDRSISVQNALNLVTELAGDGIRWRVKDGVVQVGTGDRIRGELVTAVFEISDLLRVPQSFPGREIDVSPSGGLNRDSEDDDEGVPIIQESALLELIRGSIAPASWDENGVDVRISNGKLFVKHYR